ncbi:UNVERIFIED_CONTAM: hypothetical protein Scaly_2050700 [Sesamum calycinum]|uniref:Uncharacterized protein n=1 Tax=Sesamum calycinum TaxID=2727403 RepID=A0AAW2N2N5_9LAMI
MWKGYAPNLNYLKVWRCLAKVAYPEFKKSNIGPKTFDWMFIRNNGISVSQAEYAKIIGSVMLLMNYIRLDIAYSGSSIPISLHCDSQAAIGIAKNYAYNGKRRHICIRHGAVKEILKNGIISLEYVRSKRNLTDLSRERTNKENDSCDFKGNGAQTP